jgi:hypothetical protein
VAPDSTIPFRSDRGCGSSDLIRSERSRSVHTDSIRHLKRAAGSRSDYLIRTLILSRWGFGRRPTCTAAALRHRMVPLLGGLGGHDEVTCEFQMTRRGRWRGGRGQRGRRRLEWLTRDSPTDGELRSKVHASFWSAKGAENLPRRSARGRGIF